MAKDVLGGNPINQYRRLPKNKPTFIDYTIPTSINIRWDTCPDYHADCTRNSYKTIIL